MNFKVNNPTRHALHYDFVIVTTRVCKIFFLTHNGDKY